MPTQRSLPHPPENYMILVCGERATLPDDFNLVGQRLLRQMNTLEMLQPDTDFLDIGCGCGRIARVLAEQGIRSYHGFDRHPGMIQWCKDHFEPVVPNYAFTLLPVKSPYDAYDGNYGTIDIEDIRFPYEDQMFDSVLLASVFTHMPLEEFSIYMREIRRVIRPQAKVLFSVFLDPEGPSEGGHNFRYYPPDLDAAFATSGFSYEKVELGLQKPHPWMHHWYLARPQ